jgi:hypothetical protein
MLIFILNLTQEVYFRYTLQYPEDTGFKRVLKELLTPPSEKENWSNWLKSDRIVFVPVHLMPYVEMHYGEIMRDFPEIVEIPDEEIMRDFPEIVEIPDEEIPEGVCSICRNTLWRNNA